MLINRLFVLCVKPLHFAPLINRYRLIVRGAMIYKGGFKRNSPSPVRHSL